MGLINETVYEIQEQIKACGGDGSAFSEWLDSRELNTEEFMDVTMREADGLHEAFISQQVTVNLAGIIQAAFRWGYECSVKQRARQDERNLGL